MTDMLSAARPQSKNSNGLWRCGSGKVKVRRTGGVSMSKHLAALVFMPQNGRQVDLAGVQLF